MNILLSAKSLYAGTIQHDLNIEALLTLTTSSATSEQHFGHPPAPSLKVLETVRDEKIVSAHSSTSVCLQCFSETNQPTEAHLLFQLDDGVEEISAVGLTELATPQESEEPTDDAPVAATSAVVVIGTNQSRLYTLLISLTTPEDIQGPFESLWAAVDHRPHGGIIDISTIEGELHISHGDGTMLTISAESMIDGDTDGLKKRKLVLPDGGSYQICPALGKATNISPLMMMKDLNETTSAWVYPNFSTSGLGDAPTLALYTTSASEQNDEGQESELFNVAMDATSSLLRGVAGAMFGMNSPTAIVTAEDEKVIASPLNQPPSAYLHAGIELHDAPRQVTFFQTEGELAVMADSLGRVTLIDTSTVSVVRQWKGFRDAKCFFLQQNQLAIYSPTRKCIEVWELAHGPRLHSQTSLSRDAQLVSCVNKSKCFVLQPKETGQPCTMLRELIVTVSPETSTTKTKPNRRSFTRSLTPTKLQIPAPGNDALKLQSLFQLLSTENANVAVGDVLRCLETITNLYDVCSALNALAVSTMPEKRLHTKGIDFHQVAVQHGHKVLTDAEGDGSADVIESEPVVELKNCLHYHDALIGAYKVLHMYEISTHHADDQEDSRDKCKSAWAVEALTWLTTYESVSGQSVDANLPQKSASPMPFSTFSKSCVDPQSSNAIFLSDSSKTRRDVLLRIFDPLIRDSFSFPVVGEIFDQLGLAAEGQYKQRCFGEWFMSIPANLAAHKTFFAISTPTARWLQDLVTAQVELSMEQDGGESPTILLGELHSFCSNASDLVRAFLLAAACRQAIGTVVQRKEAKTYGKVRKADAVVPFDTLMRQIRTCLLVSLRLDGAALGPFPITVANVDDNEIFSFFELVARDELKSTHKQKEVVMLETSCKGSGLVFDPSTSLGDDPSRWRVLQSSCLAAAISEQERAEYLVDTENDVQGALLLYLSHYNVSPLLCAHRSLLLAQAWLEEPEKWELLRDCVDALAALPEDSTLSLSCRLEVWQTCIRPVFRAYIFGFDHVPELQERIYAPLLQHEWILRMGRAGLTVLTLIEKAQVSGQPKTETTIVPPDSFNSSGIWPPVREDRILKRLVGKFGRRPVLPSALNLHRVVVSGCMISQDLELLSQGVGSFYESFESHALWNSQDIALPDDHMSGKQMELLEKAIVSRAENGSNKVVLDKFDLDDVETLAILWSIDVRDVRTIYLLCMYELGKDALVDDLLGLQQRGTVDFDRLVEDGVGIVCRRLHQVLNIKRTRDIRTVLGLLDADTAEWIRNQAEHDVVSICDDEVLGDRVLLEIPVHTTHMFILRLMSLSVSANADKETRAKLHSLSVLTGTIIKELDLKS